MENFEPYRILGVEPGSDPEEIKSAYRYLTKKYHPDRNKLQGSESRFVYAVKAYKVLSSNSRKDRYLQSRFASDSTGQTAAQDDIFMLGSKALSSGDSEERRKSVRKLGLSGKKAAYIFLRRSLSDKDEGVVCAAVRAIADLSAYQASGELAALWARSGQAVRKAIIETAETTGEPLFKTAMELASRDKTAHGLKARRLLSEYDKLSI